MDIGLFVVFLVGAGIVIYVVKEHRAKRVPKDRRPSGGGTTGGGSGGSTDE